MESQPFYYLNNTISVLKNKIKMSSHKKKNKNL